MERPGVPQTGPSTQLIPDPSPALLPVLHRLVSSSHFDRRAVRNHDMKVALPFCAKAEICQSAKVGEQYARGPMTVRFHAHFLIRKLCSSADPFNHLYPMATAVPNAGHEQRC